MGMCGPLVLAYTLHMKPASAADSLGRTLLNPLGLVHHLLFNAGRLFTYGILGTAAASLFRAADLHRFFFNYRIPLTFVAGLLLIVMGLALLRVVPMAAFLTTLPMSSWMGRRIQGLFQSRGAHHKFLLGLAVGTLPCCLSWAMILTAAATRDPLKGLATMLLFGLGTFPALLLVGVSTFFLSQRVRILSERVAALAIMVTGLVVALKGAGILD